MHRVLIAVIFASQVHADTECQNPFADNMAQFQLTEKLACKGLTSPVTASVSAVNAAATSKGSYLSPGCDQAASYFDLYMDKTIVVFSDPMADALDPIVRVSRTCDGERLFLIDREPLLFKTPAQGTINTSLRVFAEDDQRTLIGYVAVENDAPDALVLTAADGSIAGSASKVLRNVKEDHTCAEAIWTVTNDDNTEETATIMTYLLSLKDNTNFDCWPAVQSACDSRGFLQTVGIGAVGAVIGGTVASIGFYLFLKYHSHYQKLLQ